MHLQYYLHPLKIRVYQHSVDFHKTFPKHHTAKLPTANRPVSTDPVPALNVYAFQNRSVALAELQIPLLPLKGKNEAEFLQSQQELILKMILLGFPPPQFYMYHLL